MSLQPTLANPTIEVNDVVTAIIPNSFSYKGGKGDRKVRAQSSGGDAVDVVVTEDAETKLSSLKFSLFNTKENLELIDTWQENDAGNTIDVSEGDLNLAFRRMVVTMDPDRVMGADGNIELEFAGQAL